ncbi:hypothetical protein BU14_2514s0001 [Porphyra umbilicalis]|uniref:Uncharacterized protein n=1 Tax=Porphyra umbilicalis TaxID=2786 RepID=A0A1X6NJ76_PORUM|nr:hypothetical protein BU14_2514s0001 [Porphyra umbilicalis]|eukprot:OSX68602.1 hypothetical protein BU14_2514s0001 [Porphyra umbilicalis]
MLGGKGATLAATLAGAGALFALPYVMLRYSAAGAVTTTTEAPLSNQAVRRGAYINSGSRDAGVDPDWVDGSYQPQRRRRRQAGEATPPPPSVEGGGAAAAAGGAGSAAPPS